MEKVSAPESHARAAGLHYVTDETPGFTRVQKGKEFLIFNARHRPVTNEREVRRIRKLAIPPAWTDVWISPDPEGHLQATGRDARGRKQHRYHPRWRETRDETKFNRMVDFAKALPKIRAQTAKDIKAPGLSRRKVLATVVRILETGLVRVGNEEYARANNSYGLTTMRDRHVKISRGSIEFQFRGKSGKFHKIQLNDARLAKVVKSCQDIPGQELFQYLDDDGERQRITSTDVNAYLREIAGHHFSAKDFRTWAGTVLAAMALREVEKYDSQAQAKKNVLRAIEQVAERLGNTPSICKKCYVHPFVLEAYLDGSLLAQAARARAEERRAGADLNQHEAMVLSLLRRRLNGKAKTEDAGLLKQLQASVRHRKKSESARDERG